MDNKNNYNGLAISAGKVVAKVCVYYTEKHNTLTIRQLANEMEINAEIKRFYDAVAICSADFDKASEEVRVNIGVAEAEIFQAQKHIVNDPVINSEIEQVLIRKKINLEPVVSEVYKKYETKLASLENLVLRERSTDLAEIRRKLLGVLANTRPGFHCEGQLHCSRGVDRVIVAEELTSDMMVHMNLDHVRGIVTEHGGFTSHAAIIARSIGIPAVSGVRGILEKISCGTMVLVDGDNGHVIIEPDSETVEKLIPVEEVQGEIVCRLYSPRGVEAHANVSLMDDVQQAVAVHADGIGLFRTEINFIREERIPTEDEQYAFYAEVQRLMGERPVVFRLLDVGGDKELPFLKIEKETNPYLGWRGSRFLLGSNDIFATQVKALLRLSRKQKLRILFPMVIDIVQLQKLVSAVRELIQITDTNPENLLLGAMFEVPSACLQANSILKLIDFATIGSNDLVQYLFAIDRNNELVSQDYNPHHPVLWELIEQLSTTAKNIGKPLSICGEIAGLPHMVSRILNCGINSFSVSPRLIPRLRNEMHKISKL